MPRLFQRRFRELILIYVEAECNRIPIVDHELFPALLSLPIPLNFIQVVPVVISMLDLILLTLLFRKDFGGNYGLSFVLDGFSLPELVFFSFLFLG